MLDPAKPKDGNQSGNQTISINLWTISEVDALPCGVLQGRLHHDSTEQVHSIWLSVLLAVNMMSE